MRVKHVLSLEDLSKEEILQLVRRAIQMKKWRAAGHRPIIFDGLVMALIFDKSSTRTRVSFETAMGEAGGTTMFLTERDSQLGRGESVSDTAKVLSKMVDVVVIRTFKQSTIECFASSSEIPVINGLTEEYHPCQLLADLLTFQEYKGEIAGRTVAWIGDGNNMCNTYMQAAKILGFNLNIAVPPGYEPKPIGYQGVRLFDKPKKAVLGADLVVTDVWSSMGQETEEAERRAIFKPYHVDEKLMSQANPEALFMHCLPAHVGEEVSEGVLQHPQSVVWEEAGNRLHAQKALLELLLKGSLA